MHTTQWKTVTFVNRETPATITTENIDLDDCFSSNEIVIEVYSAALNPIDFFMHKSAVPWLSSSKPKAYGRDFAGVIIRVGKDVSSEWKIADKVNGFLSFIYSAHGSLSNYVVLNPDTTPSLTHMVGLPEEIAKSKYNEFDLASSWHIVFGTAYAALFHPKKKWSEDSQILVLGASTQVANCFVQIAKNYLKIKTVVGVCNENSIEYNKKFGYDYLVSYNNNKTIENVRSLMESKLKNEKFDVIFDSFGSSDFFPVMNEFLKPKSEGSYYSTVCGDLTADYHNVDNLKILSERLITMPYRRFKPWRSYNYYFNMCWPSKDVELLGNKMIEEGLFIPQIDSVYKFSEFQEAIDRLMSSKAKGKVIVQVKTP